MGDKLAVYQLGITGVIIDQNPLEATVPADALTLAQNVIHDPKSGHGGGLRNRNGLKIFNQFSTLSPILGGAPMVVVGTGGAPAPTGSTTSGPTGPTSPGGGGGSPAGGPPGGPGPTPTGSGGGGGGPFTPPGGAGSPVLIIGRYRGSQAQDGWFVTQPGITGTTGLPVTPGPPGHASRSVPATPFWTASPGSTVVGGYLYYPGWQSSAADGQAGDISIVGSVTSPVLRRTNGLVDEVACEIPKHPLLEDNPTNAAYAYGSGPAPFHPFASTMGSHVQPTIVSIIGANDNTIFFSVIDVGHTSGAENLGGSGINTDGTDYSRIFRYTPSDHHLVEVQLAGGGLWSMLGYALAWWNDRLWFGGFTPTGGAVQWINPNVDTAPTMRLGSTFPDSLRVTTLTPHDGYLFVGFQNRIRVGDPAISYAAMYRMSADPQDLAFNIFYPSGGAAAQQNNGWVSAAVFLGELYASWVNPGSYCRIYKYNRTTGGWAAVWSDSGAYHLQLKVDGSILYAYGHAGTSNPIMLTTTDGVTFTDKTTTLGASTVELMLPILFGFTSA